MKPAGIVTSASGMCISALSEEEALALVCGGREICVRMERDCDGKVLTKKRVLAAAATAVALTTAAALSSCAKPKLETTMGVVCPPTEAK
jgi:hypothetical protein